MPDLAAVRPVASVLSVSELNRLAKNVIEQALPLMWVAGEVSNLKRYDSGHWYFTLKDESAQIDCVMFRHKAQLLDWRPDNGMQVEVRACPTLYEARGKFQLNIEVMRRAGLGALYEAYEKLKARLAREGLFDAARKRPLPRFPRRVGVITSPSGAAIRDVVTTLRRRMPAIEVVIYPTPVQGEGAAVKIAEAIRTAGARSECEVLIVCRGGGSIEDLWSYNEEIVARAIVASTLPVVTGVGHETDFTIADFAADARAPTPTASAELVSPDCAELKTRIRQIHNRLHGLVMRRIEDRMQRIDYLGKCVVHPGERMRHRLEHLQHLANRLCGGWRRAYESRAWQLRTAARSLVSEAPDASALSANNVQLALDLRKCTRHRIDVESERLARLAAHLDHLNPERVLERGYAIAQTASGVVRDGAALRDGEEVQLKFARGWAETEVKRHGG